MDLLRIFSKKSNRAASILLVAFLFFYQNVKSQTTVDIGLTQFVAPMGAVHNGTTKPISVRVRNTGNVAITSLKLQWKVNNVAQTDVIANVNIPVASTTNQIPTAVVVLSNNYVDALNNTVEVVVLEANLQTDINSTNDTLRATFGAPLAGGIKTIGVTGSDYKNFTEAINALRNNGLAADITFRVKAGTYNENIDLLASDIYYPNGNKKITFESFSGSRDAILVSEAAQQFTVRLNGIDNVTIKGIRIVNRNIISGIGVQLIGSADRNTITNCEITVDSISNVKGFIGILAGTITAAPVYSLGLTACARYLTISENKISGGYYGIAFSSQNASPRDTGLVIEKNIINQVTYYGIYVNYTTNLKVRQNQVSFKPSADLKSTGYFITNVSTALPGNIEITRNYVTSAGQYGVYMSNVVGASTRSVNVYNNMITGGFFNNYSNNLFNTTETPVGLYMVNCGFSNVYFNSILMDAPTRSNIIDNTVAFYINGTTNNGTIRVYNNVFYNANKGYAYYNAAAAATNPVVLSDNNDLFVALLDTGNNPSTGFAFWNTAARVNLRELAAASSKDINSFSKNPFFFSTSDLHSLSPDLNQKGSTVPLTEVPIDYDGELRDQITRPDVGCDEFGPGGEDFAIIGVSPDVFKFNQPTPWKITVRYQGPTNGSKKLYFLYKINGVDQLDPDDAMNYTFQTLNKYFDVAEFNVPQQYWINRTNYQSFKLTVYIFAGNIGDTRALNDSLTIDVCVGLEGTFSIDRNAPPSNTNFTSFQEVYDYLRCGVSGPTIFEIADGTYNEQISFWKIRNSSATNNITFKSKTSVFDTRLVYQNGTAENHATVLFNNAQYITLREVTIENKSLSNGTCIQFAGNSKFNVIENNIIKVDSTLTPYPLTLVPIVASRLGTLATGAFGVNAQNNTIRNNKILGGYYGIAMFGQDSDKRDLGNIIQKNTITSFHKYGVYLEYSDTKVLNNIITGKFGMDPNTHGIYAKGLGDRNGISKNDISGNKIYDVSFQGITMIQCLGFKLPTDKKSTFVVSNNMIGGGFITGNNSTTSGIILTGSKSISILHNTINMDAPRASSTILVDANVPRCMIVGNSNNDIEALNNILYSTNGAIALEYFTRLGQGANINNGLTKSDNNLYYTSFRNKNTPLVLILRFAYQNAQNPNTKATYGFSQLSQSPVVALNNYRKVTSNGGRESKTLGIPVLFEELPYDLHTYDLAVESKAAGGQDILQDIDFNSRLTKTPDIGCDEFTVTNYDLDVRKILNPLFSAIKPNKIVVQLRNRGRYGLDNAKVALKYTILDANTNAFISSSIDTVTLKMKKSGDTQTYTFKTRAQIPYRGTFNLCVEKVTGWLPLDTVYFNDKKCVDLCTGIEGDFYIGFNTPLPGTNPARYFSKIQDALNDVYCGIADVTNMYINPANSPYLERVVIPKYLVNLDSPLLNILPYGTTSNTAVLIQQPASPTGDPDKVHYTIRFNGSNFVRLLNLNIKNTGATFGSAVHITRKAKDNIIEGCKIEVNNTSTTNLFYPIAFTSTNKLILSEPTSNGRNGSSNRITKNTLIGGYAGISMLGASVVDFDLDNIIDSNIIQDFYQFGVYSSYNTVKSIGFNQLIPRTNSAPSCVSISYNFAGEGGLINANKIINAKQIGIKLYGVDAFTNQRLIVSNNWITHNFSNSIADTSSAIFIKKSSNLGIYYNSIRYNGFVAALNFGVDSVVVPPVIGPPPEAGYTNYYYSNGIHLRNNIVMVDSVANAPKVPYAINFNTTDPTSRFSHNAYWTGYSSKFAYLPPRDQQTFEVWQQNSAQDENSHYDLPKFVSGFDLNLQASDTLQFDKKGIVVAGIDRDYNNRKRSPRITDIGSLEYEKQELDVSIFDIINTKAVYGINSFSVNILNDGNQDLSTRTIALEYSIDAGVTWIGRENVTLSQLKGRYDKQKFTFNLKHPKNDFIVIPLCVRIAPDARLAGDTITKYEVICKDLCVGLFKGDYTIGKNGTEDFPDFQSAITALICGFDSSIVFKVSPGTYVERISIPDIATNFDTTVTFISSTNNAEDVTIEYANQVEDLDHHVIQLNGAEYITFKELTIASKAKARASGIHLAATARYNTIENCIFRFDSVSIVNTLAGVLASGKIAFTDPGKGTYNTIRNNEFYGGAFGIRLLSEKGNATNGPSNIIGNKFRNVNTAAIDVLYSQIDSISNNDIDMRKGNVDGVGIHIYGALTDFIIIGNKIINAQNIGLVIDSCRTISKGLIANNMIAGGFVSDGRKRDCGFLLKSTGAFPSKGVNSSGFIEIVNNSVLYDGAGDSASAMRILVSNGINMFNNIFANYGNGYALQYTTEEGSVPEFNDADRNLLYTRGANLAKWKNDICPTLDDLGMKDQGNSPFNTGNSPKGLGAFDPMFKTKYDLHVNNTNIDGSGVPYDLVQFDIDGEARNPSTPDIGCDEYFPGFDLGVISYITPVDSTKFKDEVTVAVRVKNFGADVNTIKVKYSFDGVFVDSAIKILNPSLKIDSVTNILFNKKFSTRQAGKHIIKAYTEIKRLDNNNRFVNNDFNNFNDTATIVVFSQDTSDIGVSDFLSPRNNLSIKEPTPVQIEVTNYGNLTADNFKIYLKVDGKVKEIMNVTTPLNGKETKEYQFNYKIDPDSAVIFEVCAVTMLYDDVIEANDSTCIVVLTTGILESTADNDLFSVHPNPTNSFLSYGIEIRKESDVDVKVYDLSGRLVSDEQFISLPVGKQRIEINYSHLAEGTYFFVLQAGEKKYNGRFVIIK